MQKVLRQHLLRRNQNLKRARRKDLKSLKKETQEHRQGLLVQSRHIRENVKEERKTRREDWLLGPLAPNRDVGVQRGMYGTVKDVLVRGPPLPKRIQDDDIPIVEGDRVVVVKGRDRGRISEVLELRKESRQVVLKELNEADVQAPPWSPSAKKREQKFVTIALPYSLSDVRLVASVQDPNTGTERDVIVKAVRTGEPHLEHMHGSSLPKYSRYVAGLEMPIPWPETSLEDFEAEERDTRAIDVNEVTWRPSVYGDYDPLTKCIDELQSPHVRGRGIFDAEYVRRKVMVDMHSEWKEHKQMLTPEAQQYEILRKNTVRPKKIGEETQRIIEQMQAMSIKHESSQNSTERPPQDITNLEMANPVGA